MQSGDSTRRRAIASVVRVDSRTRYARHEKVSRQPALPSRRSSVRRPCIGPSHHSRDRKSYRICRSSGLAHTLRPTRKSISAACPSVSTFVRSAAMYRAQPSLSRSEELSHLSFEWTRAHVTPDTKKYLGSLPFRLDVRPFGGHVSGPAITLEIGRAIASVVRVDSRTRYARHEKVSRQPALPSRRSSVRRPCIGPSHHSRDRKSYRICRSSGLAHTLRPTRKSISAACPSVSTFVRSAAMYRAQPSLS